MRCDKECFLLYAIKKDPTLATNLRGLNGCLQMLAFLQHSYMLLAAKAMSFWTSLLSSSERAAGRAEPLTPESTPIPLDCVAALMDLSGERLPLKQSASSLGRA